MITAACNIAFRLGMETTAYEGKILADETYQGNAIVFEDAKSAEMAVEQEENAVRLYVRGRGEELEKLSALVCEKFPVVDAWRSWRDVLMDMADDFALRNADGQLAYLSAYEQTEPGAYELYGSPEITDQQKEQFPDSVFYNYKSGRKVYEKVYELPWEVDTFTQVLEEKIYPCIGCGDRVRIEGALSEDKKVRSRIVADVAKHLEEKGAVLEQAQLILSLIHI